jgi:hypothetical protein
MRIYIAGPYTKGDVAQNVKNAIDVADELLAKGHIPYVPHLTHFWHFVSPKPWDVWLKIDAEYLVLCDAVLRIPGESVGADKEVQLAKEKGMTIYFDIGDIPHSWEV